MFVYQGTVEQGPRFFDSLDPEATAIADPDGELFAAFDVGRGGVREMFGARAWIAGLRAVRRGHFINRKIGDPWTLPTLLLVESGVIIGEFVGEHAGDHPDLAEVARFASERHGARP